MTNEKIKGHIASLFTVIFFGTNITAMKVLLPTWLNANGITFIRIVGGAILFWITSLFFKNDKIERKDWWVIILSGLIGLFAFLLLFNWGVQLSSPVDIGIIMTLPPIIVVLVSPLIFKTKLTKNKIIGIILAVIGAAIVILIGHQRNQNNEMKGDLIALASAVCFGFYFIAVKNISNKYNTISQLRWLFLFASIGSIAVGLSDFIHSPFLLNPQLKPYLYMAYVLIFPTFLSYFLIPIGIKKIGHELVSMYMYLIPIVAAVAAIIMKLDHLYWDQPVATVLILVGLYISSRTPKVKVDKMNKSVDTQ